jgi:hypothetical protein
METSNTISDIQLLLKRIWDYEQDVFINIVSYIYSIHRRDFIDGKYSLPSILNARLFYSYFPSISAPWLDVQLSEPYVTVIGYRPNHYMMTKTRETYIADHLLRVTIQAKWIQFHNSIENINYFRGLPNLSYVNIPDSVKFISEGAFYKCTKLKNVVIGNSVTYIGRCAFQGCDIETLYLPDSITKIEQKAFIDNKNLKFVSIPNKKNLDKKNLTYCRIYRYSSFPPHTKVIVRGEIESD